MQFHFTPQQVKKFWDRVDRRSKDQCWPWIGARDDRGYGRFLMGRNARPRHLFAHRFAYALAHRSAIPDGMSICHTCDNPSCVNPDHLWAGTHHENVLDMIRKGRAKYEHFSGDAHWMHRHPDLVPRGERANKSSLTDDDIRLIRSVYIRGSRTHGATALGARFGVSNVAITNIVHRKTWKHVD